MNKLIPPVLVGLLLGLPLADPARSEVGVTFVDPQHYTDAGGYGVELDRNLRTLERHVRTAAGRCIAADHTLDVRIVDVDLAGRDEWWHRGAYGVRVMRTITWPRIELEFVWRDAQGALLDEGRERVADLDYLSRSAWVRHDSERLPYEKAMLRDWFERRFCRDGDAYAT